MKIAKLLCRETNAKALEPGGAELGALARLLAATAGSGASAVSTCLCYCAVYLAIWKTTAAPTQEKCKKEALGEVTFFRCYSNPTAG